MNRFLSYWATAALLVLATVLVSSSASAGLCANCAGKAFITNMGKCVACNGDTTSGAYKLCAACSTAQNQCQACRATLSAVKPIVPPVAAPVAEAKPVVPAVEATAVEAKPAVQPVVPPVAATVTVVKPAVQPAAAAPAPTAGK
ncbi:MAG: hypothetical protein A3K18_12785 [Lentisphaerae bacterium RIFOXYA12_64_32]|nr:MAG: hypothetical protein A3K18_12785 [Lentisphaerae bacterium RIFOXYA12_64_32]